MSKINRIRIVNLNYNENTIRIDDETFYFNGVSTLLSLRNGGGKTVLVQILMGLFVSGNYRNLGDREFKSYFTTNQPTFIMIEWCMDQEQGYFLTGMMVRKCQNLEENNNEDLEMINFTGFYKDTCAYDLDKIPIVEMIKGKKILKGFYACKKEMENLKKEYREFSYYDMAQPYQRRMYFSKIKEYQINRKEWETIIRKVNKKESGLSELFANARDEKGLVEKWILNAVESKLNQEKDRVEEFQNLAYKLIKSYRGNKTKLKRRKMIEDYFKDANMIREQIVRYQDAQNILIKHKSKIAVFMQKVNETLDKLEESLLKEKEDIESLAKKIQEIWHEEISYRIYQYEEERKELLQDRLASEERIIQSEYIKKEAEKELCKFQCARLYEEAIDFKKEILALQEQIDILLSKQKDSEEERKQLGSMLYWFYYEHMEKYNCDIEEKANIIAAKEQEQQKNSEDIRKEIKHIRELSEYMGDLSSRIKGYNQIEESFHKRFSIKFIRNITGEYEEGLLVQKEKEFEDELIKLNTEVTRLAEYSLKIKEEEKQWNEKREHCKIKAAKWKEEEKQLQEYQKRLKAEQLRRKVIMQHLLAPEQEENQKELLLGRLERKVEELETARDEYKNKKRFAEKEYENLKQGKVLELPEHILAFFEEQAIEIVYGMSWLKKNGRSVSENQKLIEHNPFLPYCIIITKKDLEKLQVAKMDSYTNFPIPMILREDLEKVLIEKKKAVISFDSISFFVIFHRQLLNPRELKRLLEEKKAKIDIWEERINRKLEEIKQYRSYFMEIEQQVVTLEEIKNVEEQRSKKEKEISEIEKEAEECSQKRREAIEKQEEIIKKVEKTKEKQQLARQRQIEYQELMSAYQLYLENRKERERFLRKREEAEHREQLLEEKQKELEELLVSFRNEQYILQKKRREYQQGLTGFLSYQNEKRQEIKKEFDMIQALSKYQAITKGIFAPLEELKENLKKEHKRYDRKQEELKRKNKYQFLEEEYQNIIYSEEQEMHLEKNIEKANKEENAAKEANNKLEKEITRVETKLEDIQRQLWEKMETKQLVDKKQIIHTDFAARRKLIEYEKEKKEQTMKNILERSYTFQNVQAALAEYSDFKIIKEIETEEIEKIKEEKELEQFSKAEVISYSGILRKELNQKNKFWEEEQKETEKVIRNIARTEEYQEDFFKKGFDNLLALVKNVEDLKLQLNILIASYDNSLKKLQVDLLAIDKERNNLEELFLEYIKDIDENMRKIDKNSTINVRGRGLKMLKLKVPEWEEQKEFYQKKLKDFVESFMKRGLEAIEKDENLLELLGKLITTKRLYDEIVGIGNIGIRLYKIEAEREVAISWQEVSSNSGGEGFLSAFVILICLLSYMRRDENDLFATGEEGKVLIMDNPFAQTNAVHLLKPLMDMAKRTNTQLICLSGLGGDSIYNRFDNIYVLNLVNSNIRQGLQYLKSQHLKGEENKQMVLSQFLVEEGLDILE